MPMPVTMGACSSICSRLARAGRRSARFVVSSASAHSPSSLPLCCFTACMPAPRVLPPGSPGRFGPGSWSPGPLLCWLRFWSAGTAAREERGTTCGIGRVFIMNANASDVNASAQERMVPAATAKESTAQAAILQAQVVLAPPRTEVEFLEREAEATKRQLRRAWRQLTDEARVCPRRLTARHPWGVVVGLASTGALVGFVGARGEGKTSTDARRGAQPASEKDRAGGNHGSAASQALITAIGMSMRHAAPAFLAGFLRAAPGDAEPEETGPEETGPKEAGPEDAAPADKR